MTISSSNIKLMTSEVMLDTEQGGGGMGLAAIADAVSNSVFPDISELDRAGGRVNLRKLFASVQTSDVDSYYGANVIVAEPTKDPNVSVTIFPASEFFERRDEATDRVASYLSRGGMLTGYLWENHIKGQRMIQVFMRPAEPLPSVGQTLFLVVNEGTAAERSQYVRVTTVASVERTFYDSAKSQDYKAKICSLGLSDALRQDFGGSPESPTFSAKTSGTRLRETVVADSGAYAGIVRLKQAVQTGAFTIPAASIHTQLIPSAQIETALPEVLAAGVSSALVSTGTVVTKTVAKTQVAGERIFAGSPIMPGTVAYSGVTDKGGKLFSGSTEIGAVDYTNGTLTFSASPFTGSGTRNLSYTAGAVAPVVSQQKWRKITPENRSLNLTLNFDQQAAKNSVTVSYMASGKWYVLNDDGSGILSGNDSSYGAGTINYDTGNVSVTFGALPDIGSHVVLQAAKFGHVVASTTASNSAPGGFFFEYDAATPLSAGSVTIEWGTPKKTIIDSNGSLTGDGTGTVDYRTGLIRFTPTVGVAKGATFSIKTNSKISNPSDETSEVKGFLADGFTNQEGVKVAKSDTYSIVPNPESITFSVDCWEVFTAVGYVLTSGVGGFSSSVERLVKLDFKCELGAAGPNGPTDPKIFLLDTHNQEWVECGYFKDDKIHLLQWVKVKSANASGFYAKKIGDSTNAIVPVSNLAYGWREAGPINTAKPLDRTIRLFKDDSSIVFFGEMLAGYGNNSILTRFIKAVATPPATPPAPVEFTATNMTCVLPLPQDYEIQSCNFKFQGTSYDAQGVNLATTNALTGEQTNSGTVGKAAGKISIENWNAGQAVTISEWGAVLSQSAEFIKNENAEVDKKNWTNVSTAIFRTPVAPIRPGSFSVLGKTASGATFNVTANSAGIIDSEYVLGFVDYQYGVCKLWFVQSGLPAGADATNSPKPDFDVTNFQGRTGVYSGFAQLNSLKFNAVAYSYIPLDANIVGLDTVQLPSDGRVTIFRPGSFAVLGHSSTLGPVTVSNGQTLNCGRVRLSRVRVIGKNGQVHTTGYTANLEAGTVTFTDIAGYSQPITLEHRIEDMGLVADVDISGDIRLTRPITHDYPADAYVSSALIAGDLRARLAQIFDQGTWGNVWQDDVIGSAAPASFNSAAFPIGVTNTGAVTERWAIVFTGATNFVVLGQNVGQIATGSTSAHCSPVNPSTGEPYFTISAQGWGSGWVAGNALRFNTVSAAFPFWCVRTILQGPETIVNDDFTLLVRGDINRE